MIKTPQKLDFFCLTFGGQFKFKISVLYCRLSAEDANEGESNSISNQRLILSKLAERENLSNPIVFYDDGYSGSNAQRPAFQQALALVENNQVSNFVVKDLSRVSRDYLLSGNLLEVVFPSKNIRFISLQENIDSNKKSSQDAYLTPLVSLFNNWYSMQCSEKIKLSKHTKAKMVKKSAGLQLMDTSIIQKIVRRGW